MKITAFLGSPRKKGVTTEIANRFLESAIQNGAETTSYFLNSMDFKGCQGCHVCKSKKESCVLKDDLTPALEDIGTWDILVFATPVYFGDVTGQFKCFFDRTWSLFKPDFKTNPDPLRCNKAKEAVYISSQANDEDKHIDVVDKYTKFLSMFGSGIHNIRVFGIEFESQNNIDVWLDQADDLAEKLVRQD